VGAINPEPSITSSVVDGLSDDVEVSFFRLLRNDSGERGIVLELQFRGWGVARGRDMQLHQLPPLSGGCARSLPAWP
jgi:hypothetical protein